MSAPIEISNGQQSVKIYTSSARGKPLYQIAYYRAGRRERRTFTDLREARREAKLMLSQMASTFAEAATAVTTPDLESMVAARRALQGVDCPVHLVVETFAEAVRQLDPKESPTTALLEAVSFYRKHHPVGSERVALGELTGRFVESRERLGLSACYVRACRLTLQALTKHLGEQTIDLPKSEALAGWLEKRFPHPVTRNTNLRMLKTFGAWAVKHRLTPIDPFTPIDLWKEPANEVEIYTPAEMKKLLNGVPAAMVPAIAIGGFAGLRAAEIHRLDWKEVHLDRGFITVSAEKAKTAARRITPITDNLKAWLMPHARRTGPVLPYALRYVQEVLRTKKLPHKRNALRHSYISYRLALVADAPRIALECGNSPEMIFRHYRELVTQEQATEWFGIVPQLK